MALTWLCRLRAQLRAPFHYRTTRARWRPLSYLEQLEDRCLPSALTVDGSQHFQTIDGFGTNLSSEAWNSGAVTPSLDILLSHGYKLFRVLVEPVQGWEDTNPNTGQFSSSNPNWAFYNNLYGTSTKFTNLWNTINYLNNHGATVWVNLQSDAPAWMTDSGGATGTIGPDHEADWATMVSTMVDYAVNTAKVHIDALGPMNEPDGQVVQGPQVDATQYVRMLDTLETQLQGYGLGTIPLVGPDTASSGAAVNQYVPAMLADPFLMPHVLQFGFHTYGGSVSDPAITNNQTYPGRHILSDEYDGPYYNEDHGQRATPAQLWAQADASFQNLVSIVSAGENGAMIWDGVDNFYLYFNQWSAHGLISYDWTAPDPTAQSDYGTTVRLYANAMMFKFVGAGSMVIGASDNATNFIEVAFEDPNTGQITIVGENTDPSSQTLVGVLTGGLTTSRFHFYYTNSSLNIQQQADVAVANNAFTFTVPGDTIFTLTTPIAPSVTEVTPIAGLTTGGQTVTITGSYFTFATSVSFGGVAASSFTINSDTQITAVTPAHAVGVVDVTVALPKASSAISAADQFQYVVQNGTAPPTVAAAASAILAGNQASAALSVLGASQYGAGTLGYTWTTLGAPPAPVTFSTNGNNSASNVTATFTQAGPYRFQATITDPAGNSVSSVVDVTVNVVATTLTISPSSGSVLTNGILQFSDTATDQFGNPYTAATVSWSVSGGGTIDNTGKFTAGGATGGPFTVTAATAGITGTATVTIFTNINIALNGTAYRWFGMSSATDNTNQTADPGLNDNNLTTDVPLTGGADDVANAYEAGGVIWSTSQSTNKVTFTNGTFNSATFDGVFDNNFALQSTTDGITWTNVTGWSLAPAYPYDLPAAAGVTYTFTGPTLSVLGVRAVGQVHSLSGNDSYYDNASEVQAFQATSAAASILVVSGYPSSSTAGVSNTFTVTAEDASGKTVTSYTGTVTFTSSDSQAGLPPNYTFVAGDAGVRSFSATLKTAGSQSITATDTATGSIKGSQTGITVNPATASALVVSTYPSPAMAGVSHNFTVTAQDPFGNTATGYTGTVHITSSALKAALPANYTFTSTDAGVHTFSAILRSAGSQSITASDMVIAGITGAQTGITVNPAAVNHLVLSRFASWTTAGAAQTFRITAQDLYGNTVTGFTDTVSFSSSDAQAALPANYTFIGADSGVHNFSATLKTAGSQSLTAKDTTNSVVTSSTRSGITINPAPTSQLQVGGFPPFVTAGVSYNFTITAKDPYGNTTPAYKGTVTFSSTDSQSVLPANYVYTSADAGIHSFMGMMNTLGTQSISATDTAQASITGSESMIVVQPIQPTVSISGPSAGVPGQPLIFTLGASESGLPAGTVYSYSVQWGDGSSVQILTGPSGTQVTHVFVVPAGYAILATATDPIGNTSIRVSTSASITTMAMEADPYDSNLTALYVGGTPGNDTIAITPASGGGVMVGMNFVNYGSYFPTGHVVVYGQSGNDIIKTAAQTINGVFTYVSVPLLVFAGNGNDILNATGSSAGNVLVGGSGSDRLLGGQGRDILIGGSGPSTLNAGSGGDILIGGTTSYDNNAAALAAVLAEWTRTDIDYATRIAHLTGSLSGGLNGSYFLNASTVQNDGQVNHLFGGASLDWYFAGLIDILFNQKTGEVVTQV